MMKMIYKILLGAASVTLIIAATVFIGIVFFDELAAVFIPMTLIQLYLLFLLYTAIGYLREILRLKRDGVRTVGKIIEVSGGRGSHYKVRFNAGKEEHICTGNRLTEKWSCGDFMNVLYIKQDPRICCLEKEDMKTAVIMTVTTALLLTGAAVIGTVLMMVL